LRAATLSTWSIAGSGYLVDSRLGLAKLGVAPDPRQRLRELQVGSPVRLRLVLAVPYRTRAEARAVLAALSHQFASRRAHGSWFRLTCGEVGRALERPPPPPAAAAAVRRPAARAGRLVPAPRRRPRARTAKERAYQRRRRRERTAKQQRAARLLARGRKQLEVAHALGVTPRTLRNWRSAPDFLRALEREQARTARAATVQPPRAATPTRGTAPAEEHEPSPAGRPSAPHTSRFPH
jgi:hypothetical protein